MSSFDFQAKPENGLIKIPAEYQDKIVGTVHVIVLAPEVSSGANNLIEQLLEHPLELKNFAPLTREEVYERR